MDKRTANTLWGQLHWLVVLAQQGSFTAAADRLGVSKAAVSQRIAELERAAGIALVRRTTRSVRLTEAGQRLVDETGDSFNAIEQSFLTVKESAGTPQGLLKVTAPVAFARQQLVTRLADFLKSHPHVRIELDLSDRINSLALNGFDLAIRHTDQVPDTSVAWALCPSRAVLVASPEYLMQRGEPKTPDDLRDHACLNYPRTGERSEWRFLRRQGQGVRHSNTAQVIPITGAFGANNSEALREAALARLGIALLPDFSAEAPLRSGLLKQVLPSWHCQGPFASTIYAVRPYALRTPLAVNALVGFLKTSFTNGFLTD